MRHSFSEVLRFAQELRCSGIATMASPDPRIQAQAAAMGAEILPLEPFVELKGKLGLPRFSRYWRKAEAALRGEER
jgi:deoxyribodipyrimidine photo-lyase